MFAHSLRGASTLPVLFALVGFALVPAASAQIACNKPFKKEYLVLGLSSTNQGCQWSYGFCTIAQCTTPSQAYCAANGPTGVAGPAEWTAEIEAEIDSLEPNFCATRFQVGVDWFVRIESLNNFEFFVGPCESCGPPMDLSTMTRVGTTPVGIGTGGGATIQRVSGGGGPVPRTAAVALAALLGLVGLAVLRRTKNRVALPRSA